MNTTMIDLLALITFVTMALVVPVLGVWDFKRLQRWVAAGRADARTKSYTWILGMEWGMTVAFMAWWLVDGRGLAELRLLPAAGGWQWLAIGLGLLGTAFVLWQMGKVMGDEKELDKVRGQVGHLQEMVPMTPREGRMFDLVSWTAGICEEFLYRGVLLVTLTAIIGLWPAVALSSAIFGLGHSYQGAGGIVKTSLVGLVMALLTVFSGSLFIPMLLHAIIDLTSGRIMSAALKSTPAEPAVRSA